MQSRKSSVGRLVLDEQEEAEIKENTMTILKKSGTIADTKSLFVNSKAQMATLPF